ncbi:MAG: hypothetical protein WCT85_04780 [Parachlamydiales bacterium]|jgi:hypothetical protein
MIDESKELSDTLDELINLLTEFEETKDDFKKPLIRSYFQKISSLGKIIDNNVLGEVEKLSEDIDLYLSNPQKKAFLMLIDAAINLKNNLWEL